MKKIAVVGGGAAGMMAAIAAGERCSVTVIEQNEKLGKKLFITGKGRCNVTNACDREGFFSHVATNKKFMYSSFAAFDNYAVMELVEANGTKLKTERGDRVFPESDKSSDVIRALEKAIRDRRVRVRLRTKVEGLIIEDGICKGVRTHEKDEFFDAVIIATGGISYPSTGSTGDGYRFARDAGHELTDRRPALVPLDASLSCGVPIQNMQGLSLKNVSLTAYCGEKKIFTDFGEMLFTHFGISGPIVLHMSSLIGSEIQNGNVNLKLDFKPALDEEALDKRLVREFEYGMNKNISNMMRTLLPASAIEPVLKEAGISPELPVRSITAQQRKELGAALKGFRIKAKGLRGYAEAIITRGGIDVKKIDPKTMESKIVKNLYFAGEVLDVDALTGGYNLQIAWSTGHAAGRSVGEE